MNIPPLLTIPAAAFQAPAALARTNLPARESFEKIADLQDYNTRRARAQNAAKGLVSAALILPVLKQIRRSPFNQEGPFSPGIAEKTFGPEFDMQLADRIAQSPRLGVTQALTRRMMNRAALPKTPRHTTESLDLYG
jgi:hypothetical protein